MLKQKNFRNIAFVFAFLIITTPTFLFAQDSPDIIWERKVNIDRVNSVIFSPDGQTLISGGSDRLINFWRVSDGTLLQTLNTNAAFVHESAIEWLSITPDAKHLASGSYQLAQLWDLPSGTERKLLGHTDWVVSVAFSPDGNLLATASFDGTVRIWRVSDGTIVKVLTIPGQQRCVAFSPDGTLMAAASGDRQIRIFATSDWSLVRTLVGHTNDVFTVAFSPDGNTIASGGYDQTVKLWNTSDGSLKYTFDGNGGTVYGLAFTPDGTRLAYTDGEGSKIKIYRVADGSLLRTFTENVDEVQAVAFSRDGLFGYGRIDTTVVLANIDGTAIPRARITGPANGRNYNSPANIAITASPSKSDGSIVKMEFFQNGNKIGEDLTAPFSFNWNNVVEGTYTLTAVDADNLGITTTSAPITVNVNNQTSAPPTINITGPKAGTIFHAPAKITITANGSAAAGVANVEFFQNGISIGQDSTPSFSIAWNSVPTGNYTLTAVVTDNNGVTASSAPIEVTVQEAPPESVKPRVTISSPRSGTRLTTPDIILSGTANDNVGVAQVLYSLNATDFRPAVGTENWEANIALVPGPNVVLVKSVDINGNESTVTSRTFTYIVSSALGVTVNGPGTVSLKDGQILEVGKTYTVNAKPVGDSIFNGWTGSFPTDKTSFSFVMAEGAMLIANFVPNPFADSVGTYLGLIQSAIPSHEHSGFISIKTTRKGTFSGKINLGADHYSLNGRFNGDGSFTGIQSRAGLTLNLLLHLDDDSNQITGSISHNNFSSPFVANRLIYDSRNNPAPQVGKYTILIPPDSSEPNSPQGIGYGTLRIDSSGKTRVAGSLADGTKISQSAGISQDATWPFYVPLYRQSGSISGMIQFRNRPGISDFDGSIYWFKPTVPNSKTFAKGFESQNELIGSSFAGIGAPVLSVPAVEENVLINLAEGDLESDLQQTATLESNNRFIVPDSNGEKLRISVSTSSGALTGSFIHPVTHRPTKYSGVVFQKQNIAEGYFLGVEQAGSVSVVPMDNAPSSSEVLIVEENPSIITSVPSAPISQPGKKKKK